MEAWPRASCVTWNNVSLLTKHDYTGEAELHSPHRLWLRAPCQMHFIRPVLYLFGDGQIYAAGIPPL